MRTIDEQFTQDAGLWQRLVRDVRLLVRLGRMLLTYFLAGGRIRRAYRRAEARGEIFYVDEELSQ